MHIILFNLRWMSVNTFLAVIPVIAAVLMVKENSVFFKFLYGIIWLLFLPNTLYVLTDITHFVDDWPKIAFGYKGLFILEYLILIVIGLVTFIVSLYPVEKMIKKQKKKQYKDMFIYGINLLVGFGIVLGRIERTNSWEFITNISKVISDSLHLLTSLHLFLLAIFFGLFSTAVYSCFKDIIIKKQIK